MENEKLQPNSVFKKCEVFYPLKNVGGMHHLLQNFMQKIETAWRVHILLVDTFRKNNIKYWYKK